MKFIGYELISQNNNEWKFKLTSDLEVGTMVLNKQTSKAEISGMADTLKYVMSSDFIKNFALKVLSNNPNKTKFAYGRG